MLRLLICFNFKTFRHGFSSTSYSFNILNSLRGKIVSFIYFRRKNSNISIINFSCLSPSIGFGLQILLLLISLVGFQFIKPIETRKKYAQVIRLSVLTFTVLIWYSIAKAWAANLDASDFETNDITFLAVYNGMLALMGIILPLMFITSTPTLRIFLRHFN